MYCAAMYRARTRRETSFSSLCHPRSRENLVRRRRNSSHPGPRYAKTAASLPRKPVSLSLALTHSLVVRDACAVMPVRVVGCHCFSNYPAGAEHRALERSSITSSLVPARSPGYAPGAVRTLFLFFFLLFVILPLPSLSVSLPLSAPIDPSILILFKRYRSKLATWRSLSNFNFVPTMDTHERGQGGTYAPWTLIFSI